MVDEAADTGQITGDLASDSVEDVTRETQVMSTDELASTMVAVTDDDPPKVADVARSATAAEDGTPSSESVTRPLGSKEEETARRK